MRFILPCLMILAACVNETNHRAEVATKATAYGLALDTCFSSATSYATYESCALKVDAQFGRAR